LNRCSAGAPELLLFADAAQWSFWRKKSQSLFKKLLKDILEKQSEPVSQILPHFLGWWSLMIL